MAELLAFKHKNISYLGVGITFSSMRSLDSDIAESNYPIRVLDSADGKVIVGYLGDPSYGDIFFSILSSLIRKKDKITYSFLKTKFLPAFKQARRSHPLVIDDKFSFTIAIVVNDKIWKLNDRDLVIEDDIVSSDKALVELFFEREKKTKISEETLIETMNTLDLIYGNQKFPIATINSKDLKVHIYGKEEYLI